MRASPITKNKSRRNGKRKYNIPILDILRLFLWILSSERKKANAKKRKYFDHFEEEVWEQTIHASRKLSICHSVNWLNNKNLQRFKRINGAWDYDKRKVIYRRRRSQRTRKCKYFKLKIAKNWRWKFFFLLISILTFSALGVFKTETKKLWWLSNAKAGFHM